jgi:superfamily I DNA and/or RNA helicase
MNVTMTRAKYLLFMVGDSFTLTQARDRESRRFFRSLLTYVKKIGGYAEWRDLQEKIPMVK